MEIKFIHNTTDKALFALLLTRNFKVVSSHVINLRMIFLRILDCLFSLIKLMFLTDV
jgi:hypothetical protein